MTGKTMRVASVPASHVYVRHLSPPGRTGVPTGVPVLRLPDPEPADGRKVPGGWWPPLMLDPAWIAGHHNEFDVFHIHFGFDAIGPDRMADIVDELDRHRKPLVYTLHDLRNPHHPEPGPHEAALDVLVSNAAEVVTLTPGAAEQIRNRWQRSATVLPHPHVLPAQRFTRRTTDRGPGFTVGVHAKSVRANMDPVPVISALLGAAENYDDVTVQINAHDEIFDPENHWYNPEFGVRLKEFADHPRSRVLIHPYFSDDELWGYLGGLDVSVLPYRFGTHSGWLEACYDLGTRVLAPDCGFYHQQRDCLSFGLSEQAFDPASLAAALATAYRRRHPSRPTWSQRRAERETIAAAHSDVYARCLDA